MSRSSDPSSQSDGFLSRWSQRKSQVREGQTPPEPAAAVEAVAAPAPEATTPPAPVSPAPAPAPVAAERPPPLTLEDVAKLGRDSDYRRFVAADVTPEVKNAAMKKLFSDPHFNVMDGLDTYIDDYGKPDPIPESMLRQMVQARALGLFAEEDDKEDKDAKDAKDAPAPPATSPATARATPDGAQAADAAQSPPEPAQPNPHDQDAAVRLQPLDDAGPPGVAGGTEQDAGRER